MLVCNCRGINEKQVKVAVKAGATHWADVHTHFGTEPSCGKCACEIKQAIADDFRQKENTHPSSILGCPVEPMTA